jgi:hypothetical protein
LTGQVTVVLPWALEDELLDGLDALDAAVVLGAAPNARL